MAEVKWIKLCTDIFSNRKIRQIESMPEGDAIIVVWLKLLTLAGETNAGGMVYFSKSIPYTEQMLATAFNRPLATVQLALRTFEAFGMIEIVDNFINIPNWEKYQSIDRLAEIREYNRLAQQKRRERLRAENEAETKNSHVNDDVNDMSMTSQRCHETDIDIDKDKEYLTSISSSKDSEILVCRTAVRHVVEKWNETGVSPIKKIDLESNRGKMLLARLKENGEDAVIAAIENVKKSAFLRGQNNRNWTITFDWFVKPNNFIKVWEGQYDKARTNGQSGGGRESSVDRLARMINEGVFDE